MNVFNLISPLIIVSGLGYFLAKYKWFTKEQVEGLSKFTFNLVIPVFVFYKMAVADFNLDVDMSFFISFYGPVLIVYFIAYIANYFYHHKYKRCSKGSAVFAVGASYSNTLVVGLPISLSLYGDVALIYVFLIITFHSGILFIITSLLVSQNGGFSIKGFFNDILKNSLLLSIFCGVAYNFIGLGFPAPVAEALILLGRSAIPMALFALGAGLSYYSIKSELSFIGIASVIKLMLLPLLVYIASEHIFHLEEMQRNILVILSASPAGFNSYLIARSYNIQQVLVSSSIFATSVLAIITMPICLFLLLR